MFGVTAAIKEAGLPLQWKERVNMVFQRLVFQRLGAGITVALAATAFLSGCAAKKSTEAASSTAASAASSTAASAATPAPAASGSSAAPDPAAPTQPPRTANWTSLKPGDCLADAPPTDPAVVMVTIVDCAQPHLAEAYLRAPIPVDAALDGTANAQCEAGFRQYTGRGSAGGPYTVSYMIDSDQDRTSNNPLPRTVICLAQGAQGQSLTGPAHG